MISRVKKPKALQVAVPCKARWFLKVPGLLCCPAGICAPLG